VEQRVDFPRGNPSNPMTDADIEEKFRALTSDVMDKSAQDRVIEAVNWLDKAPDLSTFLKAMTVQH